MGGGGVDGGVAHHNHHCTHLPNSTNNNNNNSSNNNQSNSNNSNKPPQTTQPRVHVVVDAGDAADAVTADSLPSPAVPSLRQWLQGKSSPPPDTPLPQRLAHSLRHGNWFPTLSRHSRKVALNGLKIKRRRGVKHLKHSHLFRLGAKQQPPINNPLFPLFDQQVQDYVKNGVLVPDTSHSLKLNPTFPVPKKNGKVRVVTDFRAANELLEVPPSFHLTHPPNLPHLIPQHLRWACTIDLSDAFNHVPVHKSLQNLFGIRHNHTNYRWDGMGFGLSWTPHTFVRLLRETLKPLRANLPGCVLVDYIDDILILAETEEKAKQAAQLAVDYLSVTGWTVNRDKSQLTPTQQPQFLGFQWNLKDRVVHLLEDKRKHMLETVSTLLRRTQVVARDIAKLLGTCNSMTISLKGAWFQTWEMQIFLRDKRMTTKSPLTRSLHESLQWWKHTLKTPIHAPMVGHAPPPALHIRTDASDTGYGAHNLTHNQTLQGYFRGRNGNLRIEVKEMQAACLALLHWTPNLHNSRVWLEVDNSITQSYLNLIKGGRKRHINQLMQQVWRRITNHHLLLTVTWIPTENNIVADRLSRKRYDHNDYQLNPKLFKALCRKWKFQPTIDLFATRENRLVKRFVSRFGSPLATYTDTLSLSPQQMKGERAWANPPWALIPRVISWLKETQTSALLLVPFWTNSVWWNSLLKSAKHVQLLRAQEGMFVNCLGQAMKKPRWDLAIAQFA